MPSIRIIDNKKLSMTNEEFSAYTSICRSYDRPNFNGQDLFKNLFDSDSKGNITFIKSPSTQISMEIFLFICALYEHQGRRIFQKMEEERLNELSKKFDDKLEELVEKYEKKLSK